MTADTTAYAILGLQPGADRDAVEAAYRRLIKRHHPDRAGGDNSRAAEINRAYFELRGRAPSDRDERQPADIAEAIYMRRAGRNRSVRRKRRRGVRWKAMAVAACLVAAFAWRSQLADAGEKLWADLVSATERPVRYRAGPASFPAPDVLQGPLDTAAVREAIAEARRLMAAGGEERLADASRECHRDYRQRPSASALDRCAAIDFTGVALARNDPLRDDGPFSASAVTAREMSAARMLSEDYLLIEARLDQVRARVEAAVAPPPPPPVVADHGIEDQAVRTDLPALRPD